MMPPASTSQPVAQSPMTTNLAMHFARFGRTHHNY
jgi:hypothetical protein